MRRYDSNLGNAVPVALLLRLLDRADEMTGKEWLMTVFVGQGAKRKRAADDRSREFRNFRFLRRTSVAVRQNSVLGHSYAASIRASVRVRFGDQPK